MKNKKVVALVLVLGLAVSGLGGMGISFAQGGVSEEELSESVEDGAVTELPISEQVDVDADVKEEKDVPLNEVVMEQGEQVIHDSLDDKSDPEAEDLYSLGKEEIEALLNEGYSTEDVFKVDDLSNELGIEPMEIIQKMKDSGMSVEEVREDYLDESSSEQYPELKDSYPTEYAELVEAGMEEKDIIVLLVYMDLYNVPLTDDLIAEFNEKGAGILTQDSTVSDDN